MADLEPRAVIERAEGGTPRPEFVAELRTLVEREVLSQSNKPTATFTDVTVVDPLRLDDRNKQMTKNKWISVAVAAAVVVIVGVAVWAGGGNSASVVDTVDQPDESEAVPEDDSAETTNTLEAVVIPAPVVPKPDSAPPAAPSKLDFEEWLVELAAFAENRHEGDWQHSVAREYGRFVALQNEARDQSFGYQFTTQCDLLPVTSSHLAEAPGLPENPAIAEAYQDLLDIESVSWAFLQAKCDAVDHDLVREGLAEFPSLDTERDFLRGGPVARASAPRSEFRPASSPTSCACRRSQPPAMSRTIGTCPKTFASTSKVSPINITGQPQPSAHSQFGGPERLAEGCGRESISARGRHHVQRPVCR